MVNERFFKNVSVLFGLALIYSAVSIYAYTTSANHQKYYSVIARTLAGVVFDGTDPNSWYKGSNANIQLSNPGSAAMIQGSPVVIAPPPSRCTH